MDEQQAKRFGDAVERKKKESKAASEQPQQQPGAPDIAGDQSNLTERGRPQDTASVRQKNAGKGKKTADKWNQ